MKIISSFVQIKNKLWLWLSKHITELDIITQGLSILMIIQSGNFFGEEFSLDFEYIPLADLTPLEKDENKKDEDQDERSAQQIFNLFFEHQLQKPEQGKNQKDGGD